MLSLKQTYDSNPNHVKQKFQSEIAKYLSLLIQNVGEVCNLSHDTNNFKVGTRKSGPFWRGKFYCNYRDLECELSCARYLFEISQLDEEKENFVFFDCYISGESKRLFYDIF